VKLCRNEVLAVAAACVNFLDAPTPRQQWGILRNETPTQSTPTLHLQGLKELDVGRGARLTPRPVSI
jgi:hypothetical protein